MICVFLIIFILSENVSLSSVPAENEDNISTGRLSSLEYRGGGDIRICSSESSGVKYLTIIIVCLVSFLVVFFCVNCYMCCPCKIVCFERWKISAMGACCFVPRKLLCSCLDHFKELEEYNEEYFWIFGLVEGEHSEEEKNSKKRETYQSLPLDNNNNNNSIHDEYNDDKKTFRKYAGSVKKEIQRREKEFITWYVNMLLISFLFIVFSYQLSSVIDDIVEEAGPLSSVFNEGLVFTLDVTCLKSLDGADSAQETQEKICASSSTEELIDDFYADHPDLYETVRYRFDTTDATIPPLSVCYGSDFVGVVLEFADGREECVIEGINRRVDCSFGPFKHVGIVRKPRLVFNFPSSGSYFPRTYDITLTQVVKIAKLTFLEEAIHALSERLEAVTDTSQSTSSSSSSWQILSISLMDDLIPGYTYSIGITSATLNISHDLGDRTPSHLRFHTHPDAMMMREKTILHQVVIGFSELLESFVIVGAVLAFRRPIIHIVHLGLSANFTKKNFQWLCEFFVFAVSFFMGITMLLYDIFQITSSMPYRFSAEDNMLGFLDAPVSYMLSSIPNFLFLWFFVLEIIFVWRLRCCWSWSAIDFFSKEWIVNMLKEPFRKIKFVATKRIYTCGSLCFVWTLFFAVSLYLLPRIIFFSLNLTVIAVQYKVGLFTHLFVMCVDFLVMSILSCLCCCNVYLRRAWKDEEFEHREKYRFDVPLDLKQKFIERRRRRSVERNEGKSNSIQVDISMDEKDLDQYGEEDGTIIML